VKIFIESGFTHRLYRPAPLSPHPFIEATIKFHAEYPIMSNQRMVDEYEAQTSQKELYQEELDCAQSLFAQEQYNQALMLSGEQSAQCDPMIDDEALASDDAGVFQAAFDRIFYEEMAKFPERPVDPLANQKTVDAWCGALTKVSERIMTLDPIEALDELYRMTGKVGERFDYEAAFKIGLQAGVEIAREMVKRRIR